MKCGRCEPDYCGCRDFFDGAWAFWAGRYDHLLPPGVTRTQGAGHRNSDDIASFPGIAPARVFDYSEPATTSQRGSTAMRKFIILSFTAKGPPEISEQVAEDTTALRRKLFGKDGERPKDGPNVYVIEVAESASLVIPGPGDQPEDGFTVIESSEFSAAKTLDLAGVERNARGKPVDAQPGSMDAAQTGMQHDLGSETVRNTISPEPTPSRVAAEAVAAGHGDIAQPAPKAQPTAKE